MVYFRYAILLAIMVSLAGISTGQETYWYKSFSGSIDKYPFTLHLHKTGRAYTGYYYYDKIQQPFAVSGNDSTAGAGKIVLELYNPDLQENETFTFSRNGDSLNGSWKKNATILPVKAIEKKFSLEFDMIYTEGVQSLRPKYPDSPEASFEAVAVWPKGNTPAIANLKKIINESFGAKNSQQDIGKILLANKKDFLTGYLADNKDLPDSEAHSPVLNYTEQQNLLIVYQSPTIVSFSNFNYSYSGGAHGNYATSYTAVDPSTGKKIALSGVLSPLGIKQLNKLLEKNFRKTFKLAATEPLTEAGLFNNKIEANGNFFLTGKGIGFGYSPYEIGPYAMGGLDIFIPYTDFGSGGLNAAFKK
jgi:hypothetical protein